LLLTRLKMLQHISQPQEIRFTLAHLAPRFVHGFGQPGTVASRARFVPSWQTNSRRYS
jgi:hypothetical protein